MKFRIFDDSLMQGLILGNQLCAICFFLYSLIASQDIIKAAAVYGILTLIVIYPAIMIYLTIRWIQHG